MAQLSTLRSLVLNSLGRNDAVATAFANASINYAVLMAALIFQPTEMFTTEDFTLSGGSNTYVLTNLSSYILDVTKIYDNDNDYKLHFVPYEYWDILVPSELAYVKYWSIYGNKVFFKSTPESNLSLKASYSRYPEDLTADTDTPLFGSHHDNYIVSTALAISFAMFEESDSAKLWSDISSFTAMPSSTGAKAKELIEGKKALMESIVSSQLG